MATQSGFLPSKQFFEKTRREKFCSKSFLMNAFKQGSKQSILKNAKDKISVNARVADFASLQMLQSGAETFPSGRSWIRLSKLTFEYTLFQNGGHFSILFFSCKLALVASFLNSKFKRIFSLKRGNKG